MSKNYFFEFPVNNPMIPTAVIPDNTEPATVWPFKIIYEPQSIISNASTNPKYWPLFRSAIWADKNFRSYSRLYSVSAIPLSIIFFAASGYNAL